jgi:hypothetical protein
MVPVVLSLAVMASLKFKESLTAAMVTLHGAIHCCINTSHMQVVQASFKPGLTALPRCACFPQ